MNKFFRVIWNCFLQRYVVASELARGKIKSQSSGRTGPQEIISVIACSAIVLGTSLTPLSTFAAGTIIADGVALQADAIDVVATGDRATVGQNSMGLSAGNGGSIDFTNGSLTTSGSGGLGVMSNNNSDVTLFNTSIDTTGASASGIVSQNGSSVTADTVEITTHGANALGAQAINGKVALTNSSITTNGASSHGTSAQGATGSVKVDKATINTSGQSAYGAYALQGGVVTLDNSDVASTGNYASGAYANGAGSTINVNNSSISTAGSSAEAVYARDGGTVNLTNTNITTSRVNGYGLRAYGVGSTVNFDGGTITTTGDARSTQATYGGNLNIRNATIIGQTYTVDIEGGSKGTLDNVLIKTNGAGVFVAGNNSELHAKNVTIESAAVNRPSMQISPGASATVNGLNISQNSAGIARGIDIFGGAQITATDVQANVKSSDVNAVAYGLAMGSSSGSNTADFSNSRISVEGNKGMGIRISSSDESNNALTLINSEFNANAGTAIVVANKATGVINTSGSVLNGVTLLSAGVDNTAAVSNVTLNGDNGSLFNGDVIIDRANTGTNIINLDHNSVWQGSTSTLENLNLANGSRWNVTAQSAVDNLTLNEATVDMTRAGFNSVTIGNLNSQNGTFNFNTELMGDDAKTGHLTITGDYSGNSLVKINNAGGTGAKTLNGINLINVEGKVDGTFTQQGRIVAGAYDYHLVRNDKSWLLESSTASLTIDDGTSPGHGQAGELPGNGNGNAGSVSKPTPITRPEASSYAANLASANNLFSTTLDDRLGETHFIDAKGHKQVSSLWLRNAAGHTRFSDSSGQLKTTGNRYVMQLGGDIAQWSSNDDNRFHLGLMGGYANAQNNTVSSVTGYSAKGQVNGYSAGVYATWLQNNAEKTGAYIDSWALYNWFNNSVKGEGIGQENYKSKGITAAVETGYTFKVSETSPRQSIYVQPKAQLSVMGVKADDIKEMNGTRVQSEGSNNLQSRLGVRTFIKGHNAIDDGTQRTFEPFIEANWIHNSKSYGSNLNGVSIKQTGTRNIAELKMGVDAKLNNTVNLWGNIGQQMGDESYSDTAAMVGVKVNF